MAADINSTMRSIPTSTMCLVAVAMLLGLLRTAQAHGDDMNMGGSMPMPAEPTTEDVQSYPTTYFAHPEHIGTIYTHISLMMVAWVLILPISVMFSLSRSRYTLPVQFVFVATNAVGALVGIIYNASTPDLYPNNAHHKLGWIVTWVVCVQIVVSLLGQFSGSLRKSLGKRSGGGERQMFIPISTEAMAEHQRRNPPSLFRLNRISNDSGQGTERNTESLRTHSRTSSPPIAEQNDHKEYEEDFDDEDIESELPSLPTSTARSWVTKLAGLLSSRVWKVLIFGYNFVDRTILPLGFIALCTGIITFGRFFEGDEIFTGLAHWIKGGIFFWLGIFTLGRWTGSFGDLGWAWNAKPRMNGKWRPSAEFVESALIFTYGSTNIFLEHLGNWGKGYSAEDLEHISITVLFLGGGLCGMLIESTWIRDLLNNNVTETVHSHVDLSYRDEERHELEPPNHYAFSLNPIPALVILLLGIMMSSHTQESMISSMIHKQWGSLLTGGSFARGFTYVIMYLKPPRSVLPSRPPTELLTAFGLLSGGVMFMASSGDTVRAMENYSLDVMFMYTVTMGLVALLMAWVILVIALKGWAARKEAGHPLGTGVARRV